MRVHAVRSLADVVCGCALLGGLVRPAKEGRKEGKKGAETKERRVSVSWLPRRVCLLY